ncbi:hypothetical protein IG389_12295 [Idiomarina abyssalis]|jgi:hypothetical protein|uniref:Uncharacterized protein n=3 Tax=Idiomarinaceae TaxID=267893 RepID=A0A8I1KHA0_9GAMM|nr:hypothetical protein [Idiomarina abyssalis]MBP59574.1 hypothetical protein [Idiomarina sp.]RDX34627.1 hypothetical protein DZA32_00235 [Idiomarina sp. HD9-110m-PIT-SAG04]RDX35016.1 hypothetical protein DZA36_01275 [Idiomarina sp. HD9-110m-PIT-SAG05]MBJ7274695.1 hypothetical protein [Idiomarina abyssalis]MBJ7316563.1 hypothetical protein [Idiomarina abyssalis]|tara:strand:- start:295 stop:1080 length:786 start_codon:yes stop_codon:yes gene_type:complete
MRWKLITFTCLLVATLNPSAIRTSSAITLDSNTTSSESDLKSTYRNIIDNHLNKNFSIMRTVRILINHYPEHASYIVDAAFDARENRVKAIVVAAMQAEPAVTYSVVDIAIQRYPDLCDAIVESAIQTEPAYIDDIISIALKREPGQADIIIRKAVASHPDFTESVLRTAAKEAPNSILSSITESIKALPDTATALVSVLKDFFVGTDKEKQNYSLNKEEWRLLTLEAKQSGVSRKELEWLVNEGYLEKETLAKIFDEKLN